MAGKKEGLKPGGKKLRGDPLEIKAGIGAENFFFWVAPFGGPQGVFPTGKGGNPLIRGDKNFGIFLTFSP